MLIIELKHKRLTSNYFEHLKTLTILTWILVANKRKA